MLSRDFRGARAGGRWSWAIPWFAAIALACVPVGSSEAPLPDLFTLTDQLVAARPLTREKVERLTGVELAPSHQGMNPFYALYESRGPRGYLKRVELREAKEGGTRQGGILILDLEPEAAQVVHSRISERYGKDFSYEPPQPNGPPKAPAYYLYKKAWGELRFGWGLSKGWVEVVVIDAE